MLTWKCRLFDKGSGGTLARSLLLTLNRMGKPVRAIDLQPHNRGASQFLSEEDVAVLEQVQRRAPGEGGEVVVNYAPAGWSDVFSQGTRRRRTVDYIALPSFLHDDTLERLECKALDEVWVPSSYVRETLRDRIPDALVSVLPLGYPAAVFPWIERNWFESRFVFVHASIPLSSCKGIDVLLNSFVNAFRERNDVDLIVQARPFSSGHDETVRTMCYEANAQLRGNCRIHLVQRHMRQEDLFRMFAKAHCYVQVSRAEAFGLPVLEAMGTGAACISVGRGGHRQFVDEQSSILTSWVEGAGEMPNAVAEGLEGIRGWVEPDGDAVAESMRLLVEDRERARRLGLAAGRRAISFSWEESSARMYNRCVELLC